MIDVGTDVEGLWFTNSAVITHPEDAHSEYQQVPIDSSDFMLGTMFYDELNTSEFTLGNVIGKRIHAKIDNVNGKFDDFNFNNAFIDISCVAVKDGESVIINKGRYFILQPITPNDVMEFDAVDFCHFLDKKYVQSVDLSYPATLKSILFDIADKLDFGVGFDDFAHSDWTIELPPDTTYRTVIGWIAEICGSNARFDGDGLLQFVSYDNPSTDVPVLNSKKVDISLIDTVLGCVKIINSDGVIKQSIPDNTSIYTLVVKDNQFINGHEDELLTYLTNMYTPTAVGTTPFHFMNFSATHFNNPLLESMDSVIIKDSKGVEHQTILTSVAYNVSGTTEISCQLDSEVVNDNQYTTSADIAIQEAKSKMKEYSNNFVLFSNAQQKIIGHNQTVMIAETKFAVVKPVPLLLLCEYHIDVDTATSSDEYDTYDMCDLEVIYSIGEATGEPVPITTWSPKETFDDGTHILSLMYVIGVADTRTHTFRISIKSKNGTITIPRTKGYSVIIGQGLVGATWDGNIVADDTFARFVFDFMNNFTDDATVSVVAPEEANGNDNIARITFSFMNSFTDSIDANKDMIRAYYGDGLSTYTCSVSNNTWTGSGTVTTIYVKDTTSIEVFGDSGVEYQMSENKTDWYGYVNGQWVLNATMNKSTIEALTTFLGNKIAIKATLANNAKLGAIQFNGGKKDA